MEGWIGGSAGVGSLLSASSGAGTVGPLEEKSAGAVVLVCEVVVGGEMGRVGRDTRRCLALLGRRRGSWFMGLEIVTVRG